MERVGAGAGAAAEAIDALLLRGVVVLLPE
jgi:hypothetical protein